MKEQVLIDHLFRHQYGKMVSILTRIFGLNHLQTIEDAVQDTFTTALIKWRQSPPENPEAWLTKAAKNRAIDLLRKIEAEGRRNEIYFNGQSALAFDALFSEERIEDSQLRMIFTACHHELQPRDQIAFALKTIAGFSMNEISSALLLKKETVKKRLSRARNVIKQNGVKFDLPGKSDLLNRLHRVYEVIYLIFNEGLHSNHSELLIRKELCGEAIRLMKLILKREDFRSGTGYALFALMCFHAARLESKVSPSLQSIDLKDQDRSLWFRPLINLGMQALIKTCDYDDFSSYHLEASIAREHIIAKTYEETDWMRIRGLYEKLFEAQPDNMIKLNLAFVNILIGQMGVSKDLLGQIDPDTLEQRAYLFYGVQAEYYYALEERQKALNALDQALAKVSNKYEKEYLLKKRSKMSS